MPRLAGRSPLPDPDAPAHWLEVGKVGRPHGLRGEVRVQPHNPASDVWAPRQVLRAWKPGAPARMLRILDVRPAGDVLIVAFAELADRTQAEGLTLAVLQVDAAALPPADDGEVYLHQLLGAQVIEASDGSVVGEVVGFAEAAQTLLQIRLRDGREALVPVDADAVEQLGRVAGEVAVRHVHDWVTS